MAKEKARIELTISFEESAANQKKATELIRDAKKLTEKDISSLFNGIENGYITYVALSNMSIHRDDSNNLTVS